MATYVPNATQATEPVESRTVESAALEFRTFKAYTASLAADVVSLAGEVAELDGYQIAAANSAADAAASAGQALGYLQTIRATSYGAYAEDPATDPLGNPPTVGDEYFNTTSNLLKRFNGTTWQASDISTANLAASSGSSLVGYDGGTVQDVLDGAKSLQDYAALRAYTGRATRVYITGLLVAAKPAGISGVFQYDATDTTSTDNGGTIVVGTDGRRWKRDYSVFINIEWFGAVALTSVDSTAAIQSAVNVAQVKNETVFGPAGTYKLTGSGVSITGPIDIAGSGSNATSFRNENGGCFVVAGAHINVSNLTLNSLGGGHTVTQSGSVSQGKWESVTLLQQGSLYSVWDNNGHEYLNNRVTCCEVYHGIIAVPASVPAFKFVSAGGNINDNVWEKTRVNGNNSNGYSFHIEATGVNYQYNNALRDITFECCNGGGIRLISCFAYEIINCTNWDADIYGPVRSHFYDIKSNASNYLSQGVIKGCYRWAGVNDTNVYDIKLGATCPGTVIENCGAGNYANAFIADLNSNNCVVVFPDIPTFAILNSANAIVLNDGGYIRAGKGVKGVLPVTPETYTFGSTNVPAARIVPNASGGTATLPTSMGALQWANAAGSSVYGVIDVLWDNPSASDRTGMVFSCNINGSFSEGVRIQATDGALLPGADNARPLGSVTKRWSVVYAGTGAINTSDEREKQDIAALDAAETRVAVTLKGLIKKFRFREAVATKGDAARIHVGVVAQEVMAAFESEGLDPMRYGIICYDEWREFPEQKNDAGEVVQEAGGATHSRYGVRYEELLAFIIASL